MLTVPLFVVGPPLSVDRAMTALGGVAGRWRDVGSLLYVPGWTMDAIAMENKTDQERLRATLLYWIHHDPDASWRMLVCSLDYSEDADLIKVADEMRGFLEKLPGE